MMSIGVIMGNKSIKGSCGGAGGEIIGPDGEVLNCDTCPNRDSNPDCDKNN